MKENSEPSAAFPARPLKNVISVTKLAVIQSSPCFAVSTGLRISSLLLYN
jgi:hypothetical protein